MNCTLGIDTSCYTTSVAILDNRGRLLADKRQILSVKAGGRGLAQSEMVFQHTRNLPLLLEQAMADVPIHAEITAIGVSAYPRSLPDSYMPAFLVGEGSARALAALGRRNLWRLSHQENHILAGLWSARTLHKPEFLAIHLSGGTSEIVKVNRAAGGCQVTLLGETQDLHAGQFVDRVGVALGLPFPAGRHLEDLAAQGTANTVSIPVVVNGLSVSFSGPESHVQRLLAKQAAAPSDVAAALQVCIAETVSRWIFKAVEVTGLTDVLLVGGVASNQYIRQHIQAKIAAKRVVLHIPEPQFSPDNAVGAAYYASLA